MHMKDWTPNDERNREEVTPQQMSQESPRASQKSTLECCLCGKGSKGLQRESSRKGGESSKKELIDK